MSMLLIRYELAYEEITEEEKEEGVKMCVVAEKLEQIDFVLAPHFCL